MKTAELLNLVRQQPRWRLGVAAAVLVLLLYFTFGGTKKAGGGTTFTARRGTLPINVVEGGSIEALESQMSRSEIKGYQGTKILKIVEEGYQVAEEDVKTNKVLVELDSSEIKQKIIQQDIQFQSTLASLTDAQQGYSIQLNQNESDIKAAAQKARFARMDLAKFIGDKLTDDIIKEAGLKEDLDAPLTNLVEQALADTAAAVPALPPQQNPAERTLLAALNHTATNGLVSDVQPIEGKTISLTKEPSQRARPPPDAQPPEPQPAEPPAPAPPRLLTIDFSKYAKVELLGDGAAMQQLRKLHDEAIVAQKEESLAKSNLEGTRRLFGKGFVPKTDLERESLITDQNVLKVKTSRTAEELFIKYEFPKQAEEFFSKYEEALRMYERALKETISKLAQARAKLKAAEGRYRIELDNRKDLNEQLDKCLIRAKKTGLVVYGGGDERFYWGGEERIREGATVREHQPILTIPDMTKMSVKLKIHESHIKKIKKGMKANIRIDAFPDEKLSGEVTKVGVLPDSQNRWMNPDMKVYVTTISIDAVYEWLKPGMSAKVEILVNELPDVVYVPVQAVSNEDGEHVCYMASAGGPKRRVVEIGEFNDEFIEIKKGLKEAERVFLRAPESEKAESAAKKEEGKAEKAKSDQGKKPEQKRPAEPATPGGGPARSTTG